MRVARIEELEGRRLLSIGTVTTLCASAYTSAVGTPVTLTATVSSNRGRAQSLTGTVRFVDSENRQPLGEAAVSGNSASLAVSDLGLGVHSIRAIYSGDGTFAGSMSSDVDETVTRDSVVDLLVVYTEGACWSTVWMQNTILGSVQIVNQALENSRIDLTVRLVHSEQVSYAESGTLSTDRMRLARPGDGYLDNVQSLRNQYGADLVCMMVGSGNGSGSADTLRDAAGKSGLAYSVVMERDAALPEGELARAIGHNFGAVHEVAKNEQGLFPYSHGYKFTLNGGEYRDIMASPPGVLIPYFSNPNVSYEGVPTGVEGQADVAKTMNLMAPTIARYRDTVMGVGMTTTTLVAYTSGTGANQQAVLRASVQRQPESSWLKPGGTIMFRDGGMILGTVSLSDGVATWTGTLPGAGTHTLTAIYQGDENCGASVSSPAAFHVVGSSLSAEGELRVYGTDVADSIGLGLDAGAFNVHVNGMLQTYDAGRVTGIAMYGFGGDDSIAVGDGVLMGVSISGGKGNDSLTGGSGDDLLTDGKGDNVMWGMGGNDTLRGGGGNDWMSGGAGDDSLVGRGGNDTLRGAAGNDVLVAGAGMNRLLGAGGDDTLYGGNGEADVLNGGLGNDSVVADSELDALVSVEVRMGG